MFDRYSGIYSLTLPDVFMECYLDCVALAQSKYFFEADIDDTYILEAHALFLENLAYAYSRNFGDWRIITTAVCLIMHATSLYPIAKYKKPTSSEKVSSQVNGIPVQDADILISMIFALHVYGFEIGQQPAREFTPIRMASLLNMISLRDIRTAIEIVRKTRNQSYITGVDQLPKKFSELFKILRKFRYYDPL